MSLAVLLPGQGSITPAAGRPWADGPGWGVVERIEAVAGRPLEHLLLDDGDEVAAALRTTDAAQLATLALSLVAWEAVRCLARLNAPVRAISSYSGGRSYLGLPFHRRASAKVSSVSTLVLATGPTVATSARHTWSELGWVSAS